MDATAIANQVTSCSKQIIPDILLEKEQIACKVEIFSTKKDANKVIQIHNAIKAENFMVNRSKNIITNLILAELSVHGKLWNNAKLSQLSKSIADSGSINDPNNSSSFEEVNTNSEEDKSNSVLDQIDNDDTLQLYDHDATEVLDEENINEQPVWKSCIDEMIDTIIVEHLPRYKKTAKLDYVTTAIIQLKTAMNNNEKPEVILEKFKILLVCCSQNKKGNGFFNRAETETGAHLEKMIRERNSASTALRVALFGPYYDVVLPNFSNII